ncbi:hypothetical protein [Aquimarina rhabdastrellae]
MKGTSISRLNTYIEDAACPTWSSQGLIDLFNELDGDMKEKQQKVLPIIDEKFSNEKIEMTNHQFNFLRAITLFTYHQKTRVKFSSSDLNWLLNRFDKQPTQQRASLIAMLLDINKLSEQRKQSIKDLLAGTIGESFTQVDE